MENISTETGGYLKLIAATNLGKANLGLTNTSKSVK